MDKNTSLNFKCIEIEIELQYATRNFNLVLNKYTDYRTDIF